MNAGKPQLIDAAIVQMTPDELERYAQSDQEAEAADRSDAELMERAASRDVHAYLIFASTMEQHYDVD